jgi:hypothetical protein
MADHGFLYQTSAEELKAHLEQLVKESDNKEAATVAAEMVRRALSTRTGNIKEVMSFRKAELLRKFAGKPFDTGASRVQVRSRHRLMLGCCTLPTGVRWACGAGAACSLPPRIAATASYTTLIHQCCVRRLEATGCICEALTHRSLRAAVLPAARERTLLCSLPLGVSRCEIERAACGASR